MKRIEAEHKLEWVERKALTLGADAVRSVISSSNDFELTRRNDTLETLKESVSSGLTVEIYAGGRYSTHSTNDLREEKLAGFLKKAVEMTRYLQEDEFRMLPDKKWYADPADSPDLDLFDPGVKQITTGQRMDTLENLVRSAYGRNGNLISVTAQVWDSQILTVRRASNGFSGAVERTSVGLGTEVSLSEPGGRKPEDWKFVGMRHQSDLPPANQIAAEAVERVERKCGAKKIASGRMPMIIENTSAARVIWPLIGALRGRSLAIKRSFLAGLQGKRVGSGLLDIQDNPLIPRANGSRLFDTEGLAPVQRPVFEKGILKNYYIDSYYGRKLAMDPTTGNTSNLVFKPGSKTPDELVASVDHGIYVTQFIGGNSNATTGDFSFGVMGMLIENGKRSVPVTEMNITGNFISLYEHLAAVGNDPNIYSSYRIPSLLFEDVDFAGI